MRKQNPSFFFLRNFLNEGIPLAVPESNSLNPPMAWSRCHCHQVRVPRGITPQPSPHYPLVQNHRCACGQRCCHAAAGYGTAQCSPTTLRARFVEPDGSKTQSMLCKIWDGGACSFGSMTGDEKRRGCGGDDSGRPTDTCVAGGLISRHKGPRGGSQAGMGDTEDSGNPHELRLMGSANGGPGGG